MENRLNISDHLIIWQLARVAAQAPHSLPLTVQLFGVAPCPRCQFIKRHCRCHEEGKGTS